MKSVSKKDSKNIRKVTAAAAAAATSLQNSQMAKAALSPITLSEQSLLQQSFSNFSISPSPNQQSQQPHQPIHTPVSVSQQTEQPHPSQNLVVNPIFSRHISKQLDLQQALGGVVNAAADSDAAGAVSHVNNELLRYNTGLECTEQMQINGRILQLIAQIDNHPLQKIAQRLLIDQSKLGADGKSMYNRISYPGGC